MKLLPAIVAAACVSSVAGAALAADDVVFLKSGGRMRGTVMEQGADGAVRIKLRTGEVRTVAAADLDRVAYGNQQPSAQPTAAPPAEAPVEKGKVTVMTDGPATISVDDIEVGRAEPGKPLTLQVGVGRANVTAAFDDGGSSGTKVNVVSDLVTTVELQTSMTEAVKARQGAHLFGDLGAEVVLFPARASKVNLATHVRMGAEIGLGRFFTIRPYGAIEYLPLLHEGERVYCFEGESCEERTESSHGLMLRGGAEGRLHFGPIYSLGFGASFGGGLWVLSETRRDVCDSLDADGYFCEEDADRFTTEQAPTPLFSTGPFLTPFALRFGNIEVGGTASIGILFSKGGGFPISQLGGFVGFVAD